MKALPPLQYVDGWAVDVLVPGFIVASAAHKFGLPSLQVRQAGSQTSIEAAGVWEYLDGEASLAEAASDHAITPAQLSVLAAFRAGMEWQRSRKRRGRMERAVAEGRRVEAWLL